MMVLILFDCYLSVVGNGLIVFRIYSVWLLLDEIFYSLGLGCVLEIIIGVMFIIGGWGDCVCIVVV